MARPRKNAKKKGRVEGNVVWVSEEGAYREVLDDTKPNVKLGEVVHSVITDDQSGEGHFEYGEKPGDE